MIEHFAGLAYPVVKSPSQCGFLAERGNGIEARDILTTAAASGNASNGLPFGACYGVNKS
jgi:hypothetical protein